MPNPNSPGHTCDCCYNANEQAATEHCQHCKAAKLFCNCYIKYE